VRVNVDRFHILLVAHRSVLPRGGWGGVAALVEFVFESEAPWKERGDLQVERRRPDQFCNVLGRLPFGPGSAVLATAFPAAWRVVGVKS
jgi:hypothetical protein